MCTHKKLVKNKYTGQVLYVNCGKCEACLQAKANRQANRINNEQSTGLVTLMVMLSYDEKFVPYVTKSDLENDELFELPIRRDYAVRLYKGKQIVLPTSNDSDKPFYRKVIDVIPYFNEETGERIKGRLSYVPNLFKEGRGFHPEKTGVAYYKDYQDFCKRLRENLSRRLPETVRPTLRLYGCSEYGERKFRPHFHFLATTEPQYLSYLRDAILQSWLFCDRATLQDPRNMQVARNAASYVASYVNKSPDIPEALTEIIAPKKSHSKDFGIKLPAFQLDSILEKTDKGTLTYARATKHNGIPCVFDAALPKYVIARYFPQFKGLCRLSPDSLVCALRFPSAFFSNRKHQEITNYVGDDAYKVIVRLQNAQKRYCELTGKHPFDFAIDYQRVWNCYKTTLYKLQMANDDIAMCEKYDNIKDLICEKNKNGFIRNDSLVRFVEKNSNYEPDSNKFRFNRELSSSLTSLYYKKLYHKSVNSFIRSNYLYQRDF